MRIVTETADLTGLESLLGEWVQVWCMNYIYAGMLSGVSAADIKLRDGHVVYETGVLTEPFKDVQPVGGDLFVRVAAIESYRKCAKL